MNYFNVLVTFALWCETSAQYGSLINRHQLDFLHQAILYMLTVCRNDINTVFIYDDDREPITSLLVRSETLISTIVYESPNIDPERRLYPPVRIDAVIIIAKSDQLINIIKNNFLARFRQFPWRLIAPFFVVNKNKKQCSADFMIETLWHLQSNSEPTSYYICYLRRNIPIVSTLNPLSRNAPQPWILRAAMGQTSLFTRGIDLNLCKNLYFDRTKYLSDYEIQIGTYYWNQSMIVDSEQLDERHIDKAVVPAARTYINSLARATGMKINFILFDARISSSISKIIEDCEVELLLLRDTDPKQAYCYESLYPTEYRTFNFVTRSMGFKTPLEGIRDYYGVSILLSMIILLSMTFIVIWVIKKDWSFAGFEILRLLINSSIEVKMNNVSRKIFFSVIFLYFLVFHATFSGHLAEFLTKPDLRNNPESVDDLDNPQYTKIISTVHPYKVLHTYAIFNRTVLARSAEQCMFNLLYSKSTVCIDTDIELYLWMIKYSIKHKEVLFHKAKKTFGFGYSSFYIRRNAPFKTLFENIMLRAKETGLLDRIMTDFYSDDLIAFQFHLVSRMINFRPIKLTDLMFAFIILGSGLFFATIVFLIEIGVNRYYYFKAKRSNELI